MLGAMKFIATILIMRSPGKKGKQTRFKIVELLKTIPPGFTMLASSPEFFQICRRLRAISGPRHQTVTPNRE
jgi:hypothetical protein